MNLLVTCPPNITNMRKEFFIATRHILSTQEIRLSKSTIHLNFAILAPTQFRNKYGKVSLKLHIDLLFFHILPFFCRIPARPRRPDE